MKSVDEKDLFFDIHRIFVSRKKAWNLTVIKYKLKTRATTTHKLQIEKEIELKEKQEIEKKRALFEVGIGDGRYNIGSRFNNRRRKGYYKPINLGR